MRSTAVRIICTCASFLLFSVVVLAGEDTQEERGDGPAEELLLADIAGLRIPYSSYLLCGVSSTYVIARELGMNLEYKQILNEMRPWIYGNSMAQLKGFFEKQGASVSAFSTQASDLYERVHSSVDTYAIINLVDHWVAVVSADQEDFLIIDYPKKYYLPVGELDNLWEGETLIISKAGIGRRSMFGGGVFIAVCIVLLAGALLLLGARKKAPRRAP